MAIASSLVTEPSMQRTWDDVPPLVRSLGWWVTVVQLVGYTTSLIYVWHTTRMLPPEIATHYRGTDPAAEQGAMQFAKSFAEMLTITHTHLLSMAVIFLVTGLGTALCSWPSERWRRGPPARPPPAQPRAPRPGGGGTRVGWGSCHPPRSGLLPRPPMCRSWWSDSTWT